MILLLLLNAEKKKRKCGELQVSLKVKCDYKSGPTKFISNIVSHNNHNQKCQFASTVCCETALIVALPGCHLVSTLCLFNVLDCLWLLQASFLWPYSETTHHMVSKFCRLIIVVSSWSWELPLALIVNLLWSFSGPQVSRISRLRLSCYLKKTSFVFSK